MLVLLVHDVSEAQEGGELARSKVDADRLQCEVALLRGEMAVAVKIEAVEGAYASGRCRRGAGGGKRVDGEQCCMTGMEQRCAHL